MYEIVYQGKSICYICSKCGISLPDISKGDILNIGGVKFEVTSRGFDIRLNPLEDKAGSIHKVLITVDKIDYY